MLAFFELLGENELRRPRARCPARKFSCGGEYRCPRVRSALPRRAALRDRNTLEGSTPTKSLNDEALSLPLQQRWRDQRAPPRLSSANQSSSACSGHAQQPARSGGPQCISRRTTPARRRSADFPGCHDLRPFHSRFQKL